MPPTPPPSALTEVDLEQIALLARSGRHPPAIKAELILTDLSESDLVLFDDAYRRGRDMHLGDRHAGLAAAAAKGRSAALTMLDNLDAAEEADAVVRAAGSPFSYLRVIIGRGYLPVSYHVREHDRSETKWIVYRDSRGYRIYFEVTHAYAVQHGEIHHESAYELPHLSWFLDRFAENPDRTWDPNNAPDRRGPSHES